jgi:hypothetical protein
MLHKLITRNNAIFQKEHHGIYRDDGLALVKMKRSGRIAEKTTKAELIKIFCNELL